MEAILEFMGFAMAFSMMALIIVGCGAAVFFIFYMALKPWIDDLNQRIANDKARNPKVYGHLPDKVFPWDKDPVKPDDRIH